MGRQNKVDFFCRPPPPLRLAPPVPDLFPLFFSLYALFCKLYSDNFPESVYSLLYPE
jgi:hypothetical protein